MYSYKRICLSVIVTTQTQSHTNKPTNFSLSSSVEPLSGNMDEMASKILSEGNFLVLSLLVRPADDKHALSIRPQNFCFNFSLNHWPVSVTKVSSFTILRFFWEEIKAWRCCSAAFLRLNYSSDSAVISFQTLTVCPHQANLGDFFEQKQACKLYWDEKVTVQCVAAATGPHKAEVVKGGTTHNFLPTVHIITLILVGWWS